MKKYLFLTILIFALLGLAACGNNDDGGTTQTGTGGGAPTGGTTPTTPPPAPTTTPITLRVGESLDVEQFIVEAGRHFTALHPHITVEFVNVEVGQANSQMALDGPAGVGPDLFVAPHDQLGALVAGGLILPVANPSLISSRVLSSTVVAATVNGVLQGYPLSDETYALFYNRALLASADVPRTFDDLISFSLDFNAANPGRHAFLFEVGNAYYTIIFVSTPTNRLFGPEGSDPSTPNLNTPTAVAGMEFFRSLRPILDVPAGDMNTAFADAAFVSGNAAMIVTGPWNIAPFVEAGLDFGVTTIPSLPGQTTPPPSFSGARLMFVSSFSDHTTEAHMFAEFLTTTEMQQLRYDITQALPSIALETGNAHHDGILAQLEYAIPMPSLAQMQQFWQSMPAASANIWDGADIQEQLDMVDLVIRQG